MNKILAVFGVVCFAHLAAAIVIDHSGDVYNDYAGSTAIWVPDPHNNIFNEFNVAPWNGEVEDVGTPAQISVRSGWDMRSVYLNYDRPSDTMQIGIDCYGICGDADGDGNPSVAGAALEANGGDDKADLSSSETFAFMLEINPTDTNSFNFNPTIVLGWPANIANPNLEFSIYNFDPNFKFSPPAGFGSELTAVESFTIDWLAPVGDSIFTVPDIEFTIQPWTNLPGLQSLNPVFDDIVFKFNCFAGSFEDDGVGEDNIPNAGEGHYLIYEGCDPDECLLCPEDFGFGWGRDDCNLCPNEVGYGVSQDECGNCFGTGRDVCGLCPGEFGFGFGPDACNYCPDDAKYNNAWDECGVCDGPGEDVCGLCPSDALYLNGQDECGICFGPGRDDCGYCSDHPSYNNAWDECGICDGPGRDICGLCPTDAQYLNAQDACGVCFGPGRDVCDLCPTDAGYLLNWCIGCDGVKDSGCEYNSCGMCCVPDDECECWFDEYKGYKKWDLDRIITYWNIVHTLWDAIMIKDELALVIDGVYEWEGSVDTVNWAYWCEWIVDWHHDCLLPFQADWVMFVDHLNAAWVFQ